MKILDLQKSSLEFLDDVQGQSSISGIVGGDTTAPTADFLGTSTGTVSIAIVNDPFSDISVSAKSTSNLSPQGPAFDFSFNVNFGTEVVILKKAASRA